MPATIIIRIENDNHAREIIATGAKDIATSFLPDALIHPDKVTITYRTPEDERKALAGKLDFSERRSSWSNEKLTQDVVTPADSRNGEAGRLCVQRLVMPLTEYQMRLARLIAKANNGMASTTELGCWTGKGRLAVYSAMSSLEKKGYACQFRVGSDQWAALTWSLRGELKRHNVELSHAPETPTRRSP